jgi:hypothetical protein
VRSRLVLVVAVLSIVFVAAAGAAGASARQSSAAQNPQPTSDPVAAVHHDVSQPLTDLAPAPAGPGDQKKEKGPKHGPPVPASSSAPDPVLQSTPGTAAAPALGLGFEGIGAGFHGPAGTFSVDSAPPDPNGAVGPNHFVEIVNESFAVFNKSGTPVYGPVPTNTLFSGFGGGCQANDDGDATVEYDKLAGRWIISQFSVSTTPYLQCVAVSTTGDPTGSYYRYSFQYNSFPDYPKLSVWPDAYYETFNLFSGNSFVGPEACAYDRAKMLLGQAATQRCFTLSSSYGSLLPADLDGTTSPPSGSPNYMVSFGTNSLQLWKFHVDWTTPSNSTLTGPATISVASFSPACNGGGTCIQQSGTGQKLDSLADRLMYRFAYRNFGDHESLVVDHSVTAGSSAGMRWYELRNPNGTPTVFQQGTYAPDSSYRWMGSIAMDHNGDIAMGYSVSSTALHPSIRYTGRLAGDPLGVMTQGEGTIISGGGSQNGGLSRWGDYTSMSVDPSDDCTFWYTNEYLTSNGSFNWHTRVGSFKFPNCSSGSSDFSISANPSSLSVFQGGSGTSTISTAVTSGASQTVNLSASGQPPGTTVSFNPTSVAAGGSSTMTVNVGSGTATGNYTITVTGTGASGTHTTTVGLTVTTPPPADFSISANPATMSLPQGASGTSTINTTVTSGLAQTVSLSASGQPAGTTVSFNPSSVTAGGSSTMTVTVGTGTPTGSFTITVTGTGSSVTHTTSVALTVTAAGAVVNGGFETGNLSGWSASGAFTPVIATTPHSGSFSARLGSTSPVNGDSTLAQTIAIPGGSSKLTFWYQPHCTDTITYDQIQAQIRSTAGAILATVMNVCSNSGVWTNVSYDVSAFAGQTVVLWFNDHDDGYATDPTYFYLDDVAISAFAPTPNVVQNPGFETGNLGSWSASGAFTPVITTTPHTGSYSARIGSPNPVNGNSTLTQTVTVPAGSSTLSFWYQPHCTDTITYDQIQMQVRNTSGSTLATVLNVCPGGTSWTQVTFDTSSFAGQTVVLWFNDHDDGYAGDPTYFLLDDVSLGA